MRRLPLQRRVWRVVRLVIHLCRGLWIMHAHFPRMDHAARGAAIRHWSGRLLHIIGLKLQIRGAQAPIAGTLLAMNHISWVDVYAVLAVAPVRFVAKAEIQSWPILRRLVEGAGTLFIERGRRTHARRISDRMTASIRCGETVAICPEGTTSEGDNILPFHAALFQPAVDTGASIQPLALRYLDRHGLATKIAAYVGEISLIRSLWRIVSEHSLTVELHFVPAVPSAGKDRRELARECEEAIARALRVAPPPRRTPETAFDPLVAGR